ncbi:mycofactocin-coupled SDR family oxidoreductase [Mycolicibacterium sp. XJ1819]
MGNLAGKVVLITGAARGQGRSHALRLARDGANIVAVDVCKKLPHTDYPAATPDNLEQTVKEVEAVGGKIFAAQADVRDRAALEGAINDGVAQFGRLDGVIANAGIITLQEWSEVTPELWGDIIDINLTGVWNTAQLAIHHLLDAGGGSIIFTSSAAGLKGIPFMQPYTAAKHALVGLARSLAFELAEHNIRVNTIHPTGVETQMNSESSMNKLNELITKHPRLGGMFTNALDVQMIQAQDVSNTIAFLVSDDARYITAHAMTVDAGNIPY